MRITSRGILTLCIIALTFAGGAVAQTTQADIADRLVGKPLLLRGFWADDKLRFHADGTPAKDYRTRPFTESAIDVSSVRLSGHDLVVEGQRVGLLFDRSGTVTRVPLSLGGRGFGKSPEKMKIEIEGPSDGDLTKVLDAVFADKLAEIAPTLPEAWQNYAERHFVEAGSGTDNATSANPPPPRGERPYHVGGNVRPPRVLSQPDPEFSQAARVQRISGNSQIYLVVEPDGTPDHIRIARPAGMGLDEKALEAVSRYRFAPATLNGNPIRVDIYVEVNFQIF
jgi:TonB family protein